MVSSDCTSVQLPLVAPHKRCTLCGEIKPLSLYYRNPMGRYGLTSRCQECIRLLDRQKREAARASLPAYTPPPHKCCTRCGVTKPRAAFHKDGRAKDGRQIVCKACQTLYARAWGRAHRGTMRTQQALEALPGDVLYTEHVCERCGASFWVRGTFQMRRFCSRTCFSPSVFDERFFATWSDDLAWLIGLIWSDGCLSKRGDEISISSKDRCLLITAAALAGQHIPIYPATQGRKFVVHFYGRSLCTRLRAIGLTPAKSLTIGWPVMPPLHEAAFMRGLLDGDGSVLLSQRRRNQRAPDLRVQIVTASPPLRDAMARWMRQQGLRCGIQHSYRSVWKVAVDHQASLRRLHALLYPSPDVPCLQRKRANYDLWMSTPRARPAL